MNAKDPALSARPSILLITDSSPLSLHLLKLVTRIQRNSTIELQSGKNPRILWIDLNDFPSLDVASLQINGLTKLPGTGNESVPCPHADTCVIQSALYAFLFAFLHALKFAFQDSGSGIQLKIAMSG